MAWLVLSGPGKERMSATMDFEIDNYNYEIEEFMRSCKRNCVGCRSFKSRLPGILGSHSFE
jgi:hypothetical protein